MEIGSKCQRRKDDGTRHGVVDAALEPFDNMLQKQERFRKRLGVKRVDLGNSTRKLIVKGDDFFRCGK
jgi:hypothetical protein